MVINRHRVYIGLLLSNLLVGVFLIYQNVNISKNQKRFNLIDTKGLEKEVVERDKKISKKKTNLNSRYEQVENIPVTNNEHELDTWFSTDPRLNQYFE